MFLAFVPAGEPEPERDRQDMPEWLDFDPYMHALKQKVQMESRFQHLIDNPPARLAPDVIYAFADEERRQRITRLAAESAALAHPSAWHHEQIDRLLDAMAGPRPALIPPGPHPSEREDAA